MDNIYWLFLLFLLTYEPIFGYLGFESFKRKLHADPFSREKMYYQTMVGLWVPTLMIVGIILFTPITFNNIGINGIQMSTEVLGKWPTYIVLGIGILYSLLLLFHMIAVKVSTSYKEKAMSEGIKQKENPKFGAIFPKTKREKKIWNYVSITAGVTEEMIYRGFLLYMLPIMFPNFSIWVLMVIAALLFGLAHTYQGFVGVIRTGLIGLFFCMIYIGIGSIIPLILFHALIDYVGKIDSDH